MHELALAEEIVGMIKAKVNGRRVIAADIAVGALSGAVPDSLEFCGALIFQEAFGKEALFRVHPEPADALCQCGHAFTLDAAMLPCPKCNGFIRKITSGREVFIRSVEIDEE